MAESPKKMSSKVSHYQKETNRDTKCHQITKRNMDRGAVGKSRVRRTPKKRILAIHFNHHTIA